MLKNIGVATTTYSNYSRKEAVEGISKARFKYIELASMPAYFEHFPRPEIKVDKDIVNSVLRDCEDYNLKFNCISGHTRLMKENAVENFKKVIDFANLAKVKFIITDTGEIKDKNDEKKFYADIREIGDYAKDNGVTVCIEIVWDWCSSGKVGANIIRTVNHPNIKLAYDTANVIFYGNTRPEEDLPYALEYMEFIHLKDHGSGRPKDWNFPTLGEGIIEFNKIFKILEEFKGPGSVEIELDGKKHSLSEINEAVVKSHYFLMQHGLVD